MPDISSPLSGRNWYENTIRADKGSANFAMAYIIKKHGQELESKISALFFSLK